MPPATSRRWTAPGVWLVGDVHAPEFLPAIEWLRAQGRCTVIEVGRAGQAVSASDAPPRSMPGNGGSALAEASLTHPTVLRAAGDEPEAIVLLAARPGRIGQRQVDALRRAAPLVRLLALVGPWCEGEPRSGRPWPGVTRIYWHQWRPRLQAEWEELRSARPPVPATATDVDRLLARSQRVPRAAVPLLIGVIAPRGADFQPLAQALSAAGHHPVWLSAGQPLPVVHLDAVVVDAAGTLAQSVELLTPLRGLLPSLPALLLANFPRPEDAALAQALPHSAVLSRPYLVSDLLAHLADLVPASARGSRLPAVGQVA